MIYDQKDGGQKALVGLFVACVLLIIISFLKVLL